MEIKFDTALERDMDLLIMEEFICSPQFAKIFLDFFKAGRKKICFFRKINKFFKKI